MSGLGPPPSALPWPGGTSSGGAPWWETSHSHTFPAFEVSNVTAAWIQTLPEMDRMGHPDWPHLQQIPHSLCKAYSVHGHTHGIGKGENEADGAPQFGAQTPGDEEVGATCQGQRREP